MLSKFSAASPTGFTSPGARSPSPVSGLYGMAATNNISPYTSIPRNNSFNNSTSPFYGAANAFSPIVVPSRTDTANSLNMAPLSPTGSSIPAIRLAANANNITSIRTMDSTIATDSYSNNVQASHSSKVVSLGNLGGGAVNMGGLSLGNPPTKYIHTDTSESSPLLSSSTSSLDQMSSRYSTDSYSTNGTNYSGVSFQGKTSIGKQK